MRNEPRLLETPRTTTKSKQSVEPALLGRLQVVPTKCESSGSPSSGSPVPQFPQTPTVEDVPWSVTQAARFLGVSPQTVYLWVERRQIPHLRMMGRNIRFLRDDLERFRATFRREPAASHVRTP